MLRQRFALVLLAVIVSMAFLVVPAQADAGIEGEFVRLTDRERAASLQVDAELTGIARRWSAKLAADGRLSHNPNLANEVKQDWGKLGENVGTGDNAPQIHDAFMRSPAHKANIVDGEFTHVGVGVVIGEDGRIWVTEVFMRLRSSAKPPHPAPDATPAPAPAAPKAPRVMSPRPAAPAPPATSPTTTTAAPVTTTAPPTTVPLPPPRSTADGVAPPRYALVLEALSRLDRGQ